MRIDPNVVVSPIKLDTTKSRTAGGTDAPTKSGASVVSLSAAATVASAGGVATGTTHASNSDRIDKIRALLDKGDYAVDLDQLASRIVDDEAARTKKPS